MLPAGSVGGANSTASVASAGKDGVSVISTLRGDGGGKLEVRYL
eukprot:COSAG05_NODE_10074_length_584_cov_1.136082_1_plen_43_part_10